MTKAGLDTQEERGNTVAERFAGRLMMNVPGLRGARLSELIRRVNEDDELYALWLAANVNAVERLGMTDHGPTHVKIVMNIADKLLRLLLRHGVQPGVVSEYGMENEEAEVVVVLASLFHDVGMSIHRLDHEAFSLFVAQDKLRRLLDGVYDTATATILRSEILHAIIGHRTSGRPLTLEAGIVRVADALDMAAGRSRISVASGSTSIHSLSAAAIESVQLESGDGKPVRVRIRMSNSAGVFQLDHLFREKLAGSGLERYVELEANIEGESEKSLFTTYHL
ncbi:MAG: HD domain-containing protein [Gemmatimonadota bacterium]|jgi:metal-dependent HD superfamily phosphatase/phosphodiesterase|nr:HD domain-containing protein [Gemmatimonadota bacterium]